MRRAVLLLTLLVSSLVISYGVPHLAFAEGEDVAGGQSIALSPASTELSIDPGASIKDTIEVTNNGDVDFNVDLSVAPYHVVGIDYDPEFTLLPGATEVTSWVSLSSETTKVASHEVYETEYTVTVPAGTASGGYYAVIFAETSPTEDSQAGGVVAHNRVGNLLYITVSGDVEMSGSVTSAPLDAVLFQSAVPIGVKVANTGGIHFLSNVQFSVDSIFGRKVFTSETERYVLPQTERLIESTWIPSSPAGIYKIHRSATVDGERRELPTQTVLFIQPWFAGVLSLMVIIIGISVILKVTVQRSKKHAKKATKSEHKEGS